MAVAVSAAAALAPRQLLLQVPDLGPQVVRLVPVAVASLAGEGDGADGHVARYLTRARVEDDGGGAAGVGVVGVVRGGSVPGGRDVADDGGFDDVDGRVVVVVRRVGIDDERTGTAMYDLGGDRARRIRPGFINLGSALDAFLDDIVDVRASSDEFEFSCGC